MAQVSWLDTIAYVYQDVVKPMLFHLDPEWVHEHMLHIGAFMGDNALAKPLALLFSVKSSKLIQQLAGIHFPNPIGLSAGFDYEAQLTQLLPSLGFGFETVGTMTRLPYEGNPRPILGRLPKSKSLMVNKGFKNTGTNQTIARLENVRFAIPIGMSVGRSNNPSCNTQRKSIQDILTSFQWVEGHQVQNAYYELNISCPNLFGNVAFYSPKKLDELLQAVDKLHIKKPIFVKMPIEKSDKEVKAMLAVIAQHAPKGVIFGNLQKDRKNKYLDKSEVAQFPRGNFSGKPTFERSNELIELCYRLYKDRFIIIGSGGVFSAEDAYEKIGRGASLVQLITGLIFQGPQLVSQINLGLLDLLKRDGFTSIKDAIGHKVQ